ncbi:nicotinic acid mononucleotide adenyltransferase [Aequorivita sp. Q41]|uniref:toxin-antitoxin system YwqK family antitoxin n=1 Tax=Aequorivita sp. Q41 TaxID=3153300 RepID=UPI0032426978
MKNIITLLAVVLITNVALAQDNKKNTYFLDGDVIEATIYHENGMIAQTGYYTQENKLTGEWVSFDENGNKTAVAQYDNGKKVGTWLFYQGNTQREVSYNDSQIAKVTTWKLTDTYVVSNNP